VKVLVCKSYKKFKAQEIKEGFPKKDIIAYIADKKAGIIKPTQIFN